MPKRPRPPGEGPGGRGLSVFLLNQLFFFERPDPDCFPPPSSLRFA